MSETDHVILHLVQLPIETGTTVKLKVDQAVRFDHMQQHSGQHLLSQCFYMHHQSETVGFHLGSDISTIDLDRSYFSSDEIDTVETLANSVIHENRQLRVYHVTQTEAGSLPLRKQPVDIPLMRIVEIQGFDWSACCGTHVKQTGELGLIKIVKWERYKGGTRVHFLVGMRAFAYARKLSYIVRESTTVLGIGEDELAPAIQHLAEEKKQFSKEIKQLSRQLIRFEAESMLQNADNIGHVRYIEAIWEQDEQNRVTALVRTLIESHQVLVVMRMQNRMQLIVGKSKALVLDLSSLVQNICQHFDGKGGGGPQLIQIVFPDHARYHRAFEYVKNELSQLLVS